MFVVVLYEMSDDQIRVDQSSLAHRVPS
jgi:hypothetical protein